MKYITILALAFLLSAAASAQTASLDDSFDLEQRSPLNAVLDNDTLNISYNHLVQPVTLRVHNMVGRIVLTKRDVQPFEQIDFTTAPRGVYMVAVCSDDGDCFTSKLKLED